MRWFGTAGLFLVAFFFCSQIRAQQETDHEEILVYLRAQEIGGFEINAIFDYNTNELYLPVTTLFTLLKINQETAPGHDSIKGYFLDENKKYLINFPDREIKLNGQTYDLDPGQMLKTSTGLYLQLPVFGEAFGLFCSFNFRSLSVELKTDHELPAIKEMRLERMRENIMQLHGEITSDTVYHRRYHWYRFGMFEWSANSIQVSNSTSDTRLSSGIGAELFGGETNVFLRYSTREGFKYRNQQYSWRWANNKPRFLRQVKAGRIRPGSISSIYDPLEGIVITNSPTTYRRSFGEYTLTGNTVPGWTAELYVNNVLVDYVTADASGFYSFDVPLVYGSSEVMLKFYGPYGEERTREQTISIPYNFLPKGEMEYIINGGLVSDTAKSLFGRGEINYGISRHVTLGGGYEHLSSIPSKPGIPFSKTSITPFTGLLISAEYAHNVRTSGTVSYRSPSNLLLEFDLSEYTSGQQAINFNYLRQINSSLSVPLRFNSFNGYTRATYRQYVYETLTFHNTELLISGNLGPINANLTTYANWIDGGDLNINSNLSLAFRLTRNFTIRNQTQIDVINREIFSYRFELEKRLSTKGVISLSYDENLRSDYQSINLSFRYDLPFSQVNLSNRLTREQITTTQGARGSLAFGSGNNYIHTGNRSTIGRGGITIIPFLDLNHNKNRDKGEPTVKGLKVRINGGQILKRGNDEFIRILELEPYTSYLVELDDTGLENIAWQIEDKTLKVFIDPNQFKKLEIPVLPLGEVNGMVYLKNEDMLIGQSRVLVNIFSFNGNPVKQMMSEYDGYFTFLGLSPGVYYAQIDPEQLKELDMTAEPALHKFEIKQLEYGDIVDGIDFIIKPEMADGHAKPDSKNDERNVRKKSGKDSVEEKHPKQKVDSIPNTEAPNDTIKKPKQPEKKTAPGAVTVDTIHKAKPLPLNTTAGRYYVQAGAFNSSEGAEAMLQSILDAGIENYIGIIETGGLYKVRIGYYKRKSEAISMHRKLTEAGISCFVGYAR